MYPIRTTLILACTFLWLSTVALAEPVDYRLPPEIQPAEQSVELHLDPGIPNYTGRTVIQIDIAIDVDRIGIYQVDLDMPSITLRTGSDSRALESAVGEYNINWLSDGKTIPAGHYELIIEFNGDYATDSLGMHRVRFEDNDYVFTQMEAMKFRRAVPSFDEPSFKIPYQLTIIAPAGLAVVANAPVESESTEDGWRRVEFMPTKPISSYLIAFAVGPLDRAEIPGLTVPGHIYTPQGHADELGFVLRHTAEILHSHEEFFALDYPFRKLDFIAVPEFAIGAMENPGLVTFRTDILLIGDKATGNTAAFPLMVIAHELAHMWFGDLVTMQWWDDLWLNEAFASWLAASTMQSMYPQYEFDLLLPQMRAFKVDQQTGSKPIRMEKRTEADENEGRGLAYSKGETLLRMLENYVGAEAWQAGVRKYLAEFAWDNATEADLWNVMSASSGIDVSNVAGSFLNQPGFPILSFTADGRVSQSRYLAYGLAAPSLQWLVPLNVKYKIDGEVKETFYLLDDKIGAIDLPQDADWILPDAGATGYFRWETDIDQFYALVDDLAELEDREKIALLDNSDALLQARKLSFEDYMFVIKNLMDDPHPLVLLPAIEKVMTIGTQFIGDDNRQAFARFVDAELSQRFADVGIDSREDDSEGMLQLRPRLVRILGQYGSDAELLAAAEEKAALYLKSAAAVDSNLAIEVLRVAALNGDGQRYENYIEAYLNSADAVQRTTILKSIYFRDPDVVRAALDFSISDAVPAGDAVQIITSYAQILDDHKVLYDWLESNLVALEAKIPSHRHQMLPANMAGMCDDENRALLVGFFAERGDKYAASLDRSVETVSACIAGRSRDAAALMEFLSQYDRISGT